MPATTEVLAGLLLSATAPWSVLAHEVPASAQIIDQRVFNVLDFVPPPAEANDSTVRLGPAQLI